MPIIYIKYVSLKPYEEKTQWKKNPSEGKRVHILYNLILLKEYNTFAPLIGISFEISESPHSNVLHQFFKSCGW